MITAPVTTFGMTMAEAISKGQGIERPFRCEAHEDRQASASVNVLKGVWFCHACHAKGKVEDRKAPPAEDILAMLEPERSATIYPDAYLELYDLAGWPVEVETPYWLTRLGAPVVHAMGMGQDPFTGEATFPVFTPAGRFAGVGRRHEEKDENGKVKKFYKYPRGWSASTQVGGTLGKITPAPVLCIVEGYADAAAVVEVGCPAVAQWGSQLHLPQIEMLAKLNPKLILLGQDMDEAGERGVSAAFKQLRKIAPMKRVRWPKKDPGECGTEARLDALLSAVSAARYGDQVLPAWEATVAAHRAQWEEAMEEAS